MVCCVWCVVYTLTSADESLLVDGLLTNPTLFALLERLHSKGVGVDGFEILRL